MDRLVISQNQSVDGVTEDPTGEEGTPFGGWFARVGDVDRAAWARSTLDELNDADAVLLGRRTYETFAARWPTREGDLAARMNEIPKFVVSSTLADVGWSGTRVLAGDVTSAADTLEREVAGTVVVYGSGRLALALAAHGLVDALRLVVFPVVLGTGNRLLGDLPSVLGLRLREAQPLGENLVRLDYDTAR